MTWLTRLAPGSPKRPPDYRLQLATHLAGGRAVPEPWIDPWVRRARDHLLGVRTSGTVATPDDVGAAVALYRRGPAWRRTEVEARLLAGEPAEVVAAKTGVPDKVVEAYERLCFAVTDRLQHSGYIVHHAIKLHAPGAEANLGTHLKHYGYFAGPAVLDSLFRLLTVNGDLRPGGLKAIRPADGLEAMRAKVALLLRTTAVTAGNAALVSKALARRGPPALRKIPYPPKLAIDVHLDQALLTAPDQVSPVTTPEDVEQAA
jgi:hypothetical protein